MSSAATDTMDRIERSILIKAPRSRVWRALSSAEEFGAWFGANLKGQAFRPGQRTQGPITIPGYTHVMFDVIVERLEPESLMAWRWHPYAIEPGMDYEKEPTTLVTFELEAVAEGIMLRLVESGFDQLPAARRDAALRGSLSTLALASQRS